MRAWLILLLALSPLVLAAEYPFDASLYDSQRITAQFTTESNVTLSGIGRADKLEATVSYVPEDSETIDATPEPISVNPLTFSWKNVGAGTYRFSYTTTVHNQALKPSITRAVTYPFQSPAEISQYLSAQEITDTNTAIRQKSGELASGKTDAVEVVFAIAQWVGQNVEYDLNTVTAQASQRSSWVMQNKYGVCDEITSLFISLVREAGIPARFVSGFAYTNVQSYQDHWGPHGWAEVWLPSVGWVPVDVTYGEILYVDATHIVIRRGLDSKNTAVDYALLARNLNMQPGELATHGVVLDKAGSIEETIEKKLSALYDRTGSGSGNVITATLTNSNNRYLATELHLATTSDTKLLDKREKTILLPPKSTRRISWRIIMPDFERGFEYTVPFTIVSQSAGNATVNVAGNQRYEIYPEPPEEESEQTLLVDCQEPQRLYVGESAKVTCTSPQARVCGPSGCGTGTTTVEFEAKSAGAYPISIVASAGSDSGTAIVTFVVSEPPSPSISITLPATTTIDDTPTLVVRVETELINDAVITVDAERFTHNWNMSTLESKQFELRFPANYLDAGENTLLITVKGKDKNGEPVEKTAQASITLEATTFERLQLFLMHLFS